MIRYPLARDILSVGAVAVPAYKVVTYDSGDAILYNVASDGTMTEQARVTVAVDRVQSLANDRAICISGTSHTGGLWEVTALHVVDFAGGGSVTTHSIASGRFASVPGESGGRLYWVEAPTGAVGTIELKLMSSTLTLGDVQTERTDTHTGGAGGGAAAYLDRFGAFWLGDDYAAVSTDQVAILTSGFAWELGTATDSSAIAMAYTATAASPVSLGTSAIHAVDATVSGTPTQAIRYWDGEIIGGNPFTSLYLDDKWPTGVDTLGIGMYLNGSTVHRLFEDVLALGNPYKIGTLTTAGVATPDPDITLDLTGVDGTPLVLAPGT